MISIIMLCVAFAGLTIVCFFLFKSHTESLYKNMCDLEYQQAEAKALEKRVELLYQRSLWHQVFVERVARYGEFCFESGDVVCIAGRVENLQFAFSLDKPPQCYLQGGWGNTLEALDKVPLLLGSGYPRKVIKKECIQIVFRGNKYTV